MLCCSMSHGVELELDSLGSERLVERPLRDIHAAGDCRDPHPDRRIDCRSIQDEPLIGAQLLDQLCGLAECFGSACEHHKSLVGTGSRTLGQYLNYRTVCVSPSYVFRCPQVALACGHRSRAGLTARSPRGMSLVDRTVGATAANGTSCGRPVSPCALGQAPVCRRGRRLGRPYGGALGAGFGCASRGWWMLRTVACLMCRLRSERQVSPPGWQPG